MTTQKVEAPKVDVQKFNAWFNEHWQGKRDCPVCGNNSLGMGQEIVEIRGFHGGKLVGGPIYPLVAVTCGTCGYTMLFNAILSGLIKAQE